jgi:hypothetical protein
MTLIDPTRTAAPSSAGDITPVSPPEADVTRPVVAAVGDTRSGGGIGTGFVKGAAIGAVVVFLVCGGIALVAGTGIAGAIGIGAFAAFWGGPGFGGMMGAVLHDARHPEQ